MKILIVEDEPELRKVMSAFLAGEHYVVETAADYASGLSKIANYSYDCILLDVMLPGGSGISLLRELRNLGKLDAVIVVSAKDAVEDKVQGLELGADDYLAKPFHLSELLARIKTVIRRNNHHREQALQFKNVKLFPEDRKLLISEREVLLNRKEYDLFYYFMIRPGKLVPKTALAEAVWGDDADQADSLDFIYSQIKNLRKKLKDSHAEIDFQAVYGVGYKLV
ncbi:response regulator transcription factor [Sphingobacterium bambusae]|uniref:Response regulator transcription factor n=1 Tax=Sphingobacterium bambusae TaxID=662858 RepID=A0ABW6BMY8_9SPHI|nr:response regulator transcription factor [Sphingobacterium bambusae]WPL47713.1 response regulator transcription factor [Sphingobacterium bambusae]